MIPLSLVGYALVLGFVAGEYLDPLGLQLAGIFVPLTIYGYWQLTEVINTTVIRLTADHLIVRHTPLLWFGGRSLDVKAVKHVQWESCTNRRYTRSIHEQVITYRVYAHLRDGRKVPLIKGLARQEQAACLRQAVEHHLRTLRQA